jgi:hypothetical protein
MSHPCRRCWVLAIPKTAQEKRYNTVPSAGCLALALAFHYRRSAAPDAKKVHAANPPELLDIVSDDPADTVNLHLTLPGNASSLGRGPTPIVLAGIGLSSSTQTDSTHSSERKHSSCRSREVQGPLLRQGASTTSPGGSVLKLTSQEDSVHAARSTVASAVLQMQGALQAELAEQHLSVFSVIGKGGFGTVYHGAPFTI